MNYLEQTSWNLHRLAAATHGQWLYPTPKDGDCKDTDSASRNPGNRLVDQSFARIVTDTCQVQAGDVFLAIKGERFDGHDFVEEAVRLGARAVIVHQRSEGLSVLQLYVSDTRVALGDLGRYHRQRMPNLRVVALTGSSGKTTTKEMLGSILNLQAPTLTTRGNRNNDLGVPMMLLELTPTHQYAVLELGANHVGEIAYTTAMVQPQIAGVLNIGTAHIGEFGGRDGIARAKCEIFASLPPQGIAIIPAYDDYSEQIAAAAKQFATIRFGSAATDLQSVQPPTDVTAQDIALLPTSSNFTLVTCTGSIPVALPFPGSHNINNALAAAAFALALKIPLEIIAQGLFTTVSAKGRLVFDHRKSSAQQPITLIDDSYNANPHSMIAAAQVLSMQAGYRIMVTGDMAELGDIVTQLHREVGSAIAALAIDEIVCVGRYATDTLAGFEDHHRLTPAGEPGTAHAFLEKSSAEAYVTDRIAALNQPICILFKGSRSAAMETILNAVLEKTQSC